MVAEHTLYTTEKIKLTPLFVDLFEKMFEIWYQLA
jgi:hypothetical protein